jgi:hypothetical protein
MVVRGATTNRNAQQFSNQAHMRAAMANTFTGWLAIVFVCARSEVLSWATERFRDWLVVGECGEIGLGLFVPAHSGYGVFPSTFHRGESVCVRFVAVGDAFFEVRILRFDDCICC